MRNLLKEVDWGTMFEDRSVEDMWQLFKSKLLFLQEEFIPESNSSQFGKPKWMDRQVLNAMKDKARAWKKYQFCRTNGNYVKYKHLRNRFKSVMSRSRLEFEKKIASEIQTQPKAFWNYIRRKSKPVSRVQRLRLTDGSLTDTDEETAQCFNSYFASVFTREDPSQISLLPLEHQDRALLTDISIQDSHILEILDNLKVNKAAGPDGIHPRTLHETRFQIVKPLRYLFTKSFEQGTIPRDWKDAVVVPIYKNGRKDVSQNYRPVSLTCIVSKMMERLIRDSVLDYLMLHRLLSERQYGFIPGRSCTLQLLLCIEEWSLKLDKGEQVDVIYTDFSKAFDTVSHSKLLQKLQLLGISGKVLCWIRNFLSGRRQKVRVEESCSSWEKVLSGVPQGSVLGPVLFLTYINDLPLVVQDQFVKLFADDAKLDRCVATVNDSRILQCSLDNVTNWSEEWALRMNAAKCKVLHLSRGKTIQKYEYFMNTNKGRVSLQEVECEKDLGVYVDEKLTFEHHVSKSIKTANKVTGIICRNFRNMGKDVFLNLYKSLVRPHLEYGSVVWSPRFINDQKRIEAVQRRATKLAPNVADLSYPQRLRYLGIPSLQYRRIRADMIQVYKIMHGIDRIDSGLFFEESNTSRTRGHRFKISKVRCKTSFRKAVFSQRVVDDWNALPDTVVEAPNINCFKTRLNSFWKNHPCKFSPSFYR